MSVEPIVTRSDVEQINEYLAAVLEGSPELVYAIHAVGSDRVKVGVTTDLEARLRQLSRQSPYPLKVIGAVPGGRESEVVLHELLAEWRIHGEWFELQEPERRRLQKTMWWTTFENLQVILEHWDELGEECGAD